MKFLNRLFCSLCCITIGFSVFSCMKSTQNVVLDNAIETHHVGEGEERIRVSDLSKEATITTLDSTVFVGGTDKVLVNGNFIYILHNQNLFCFDHRNGVLQAHYKKQGRSANEYVKILDFDIDSVNGNVYLLCQPMKIIELSRDLTFSRVIDVKEGYDRMAVDDGQMYLYSYYLHKLDVLCDGETTCLMEFPNTPAWIFGETSVFHKTADGILFTPEPFASIYSINGKDIEHIIHLSYLGEEETMDRLNKSKLLLKEETLKYPFPKIRRIIVMNNLMIVIYSYGIRVRTCLIDKANHKIVKDGILNAANPFPTLCYDHTFFAIDVLNPDPEMSILDTASVAFTYSTQPARENEQLAVFKYVFNPEWK